MGRGRRPRRAIRPTASSGSPNAIALGEHLFNEPRLSADGAMSCATCHVAGRDWA